MASVTLPQGRYIGNSEDCISSFHGIPYAQPFKRFQLPQPPIPSNEEFKATEFSYNSPQNPSRLDAYLFIPDPPAKYDEAAASVLSVYTPSLHNAEDSRLRPVIVWIHGGAFLTGGSQLSGYQGTLLARDADAVVVTINYRLGALGFLYHPGRSIDKNTFEWVRANISAFGGDPGNVTSFGQSAGAYITQTLLELRPDLLERGILQSSPAAIENPPELVRNFIRTTMAPFAPTATFGPGLSPDDKSTSTGQTALASGGKKQILVGWTKTDGLIFSQIGAPLGTPVSDLKDVTDELFRDGSKAIVEKWKNDGHDVTMFEMNWSPPHLELGPTHCTDLPLVFGTETWGASSFLSEDSTHEWKERGKRWRQALGRFVENGTKIETTDGIEVFHCICP
ncbi:Alpha/Beta hydrolase protein [Microdochium bolleyi]|uniref:Alpha/Beta hydrolase protein n=1 Tax=Microdochium bolleyi TaxID=196109 RepID=A0A136IMX3_9PEZI|nr:Alpha/Beta hydrolase protein [Microdochium bolleyi]